MIPNQLRELRTGRFLSTRPGRAFWALFMQGRRRRRTKAPSPLVNGCISYWALNEASGPRLDAHGTNHLTDNNTVGQAAGIIGSAGQFVRANSEYLSVAHNASLSLSNTSFTISLWAWLDSLGADRTLASKYYGGSATREFLLTYLHGGGTFQFVMNLNDTVASLAFGTPAVNTWLFLAAWFDLAAGTMSIQVNNGTVNSASGVSAANADVQANAFLLGARDDGGPVEHMNGRIDEVGLWRRVLTADERAALCAGGAGLAYPFQ